MIKFFRFISWTTLMGAGIIIDIAFGVQVMQKHTVPLIFLVSIASTTFMAWFYSFYLDPVDKKNLRSDLPPYQIASGVIVFLSIAWYLIVYYVAMFEWLIVPMHIFRWGVSFS